MKKIVTTILSIFITSSILIGSTPYTTDTTSNETTQSVVTTAKNNTIETTVFINETLTTEEETTATIETIPEVTTPVTEVITTSETITEYETINSEEFDSGTIDISNIPEIISSAVEECISINRNKILEAFDNIPAYEYGVRIPPAIGVINYYSGVRNFTGETDTSNYIYYGKMSITGYTPKCEHCCGNTEGITASGVEAISGYTVAAGYDFPFGTTLYIEGYGFYVVEDRGFLGDDIIDIAAPTHNTCYSLTESGVDVYVVPHKINKGE